MNNLRIALVGAYGHYKKVLDEIVDLDQAALVAVAPGYADEDLAPVFKHKLAAGDTTARFADHRAMLEQAKPDIVIVSTRLDRVAPVAIDAARAGCHVVSEKPLAIDHESLHALRSAVGEANVRLIAMLTMRTLPAFVTACECFRRGDVGEVVIVNARKSYQWGARPEWFGRRETYGGTIGWVGIHAFDMIHYITGQGFVSVAAMQSNQTHPDRPACEDNCALILELANGAHATVSLDYGRPSTAPTHGDDWIRIVGERGVLEANGSRETCSLIAEGQAPRDVPLAPSPPMYRAFFLSLLGRAGFDAQQPDDPFLLTLACLCARDAADSKSIVQIPQGIWD